MASPTREEIESRLAQLRRDLDLAHATYSGAIQDCEWFLSQYDTPIPEPIDEDIADA